MGRGVRTGLDLPVADAARHALERCRLDNRDVEPGWYQAAWRAQCVLRSTAEFEKVIGTSGQYRL